MTEGQSCSTSANYVTWPSTWHLRGLNLPSSLQTESYLCHLSKSRIYTTFYLREILIATRYYFIILVCVFTNYVFFVFLLFHEAQRGLMVSWERRLAFLLDENVHRYITFGQASIILKFNRKKIKNKQRNRSKYDKFFPITASCEAGRMFTSKRQMKPAAVMDAQDGTP